MARKGQRRLGLGRWRAWEVRLATVDWIAIHRGIDRRCVSGVVHLGKAYGEPVPPSQTCFRSASTSSSVRSCHCS